MPRAAPTRRTLLFVRAITTAIAAATLVIAGCGASGAIASADPPTPPPEPKTVIDNAGTYSVGTDIVPGTYSSPGPVAGGACYWKRLSSLNKNDIIDSAMSRKPQVVQIDPSDKAFETDGCQPWQKTDSATPDANSVPQSAAEALLRAYIDSLNAGARQSGGGQLPPP
jgi:hypothetical protein